MTEQQIRELQNQADALVPKDYFATVGDDGRVDVSKRDGSTDAAEVADFISVDALEEFMEDIRG